MTSIDERLFDERMSRGRVLRLGAVGAVGVIAAGCGGSSKGSSGTGSAVGKSDKPTAIGLSGALITANHVIHGSIMSIIAGPIMRPMPDSIWTKGSPV